MTVFDGLRNHDDPGIVSLPALDRAAVPIRGPRWTDRRLLIEAAAGVLILAGLTYLALIVT